MSWEACANVVLTKYFQLGKTSVLRNRISSFQQLTDAMMVEAWEQLQEYIVAGPHHGMEKWIFIQSSFHDFNRIMEEHLDVAYGGSFLSLSVTIT